MTWRFRSAIFVSRHCCRVVFFASDFTFDVTSTSFWHPSPIISTRRRKAGVGTLLLRIRYYAGKVVLPSQIFCLLLWRARWWDVRAAVIVGAEEVSLAIVLSTHEAALTVIVGVAITCQYQINYVWTGRGEYSLDLHTSVERKRMRKESKTQIKF